MIMRGMAQKRMGNTEPDVREKHGVFNRLCVCCTT